MKGNDVRIVTLMALANPVIIIGKSNEAKNSTKKKTIIHSIN